MGQRLILASGSPRRRDLLATLGLTFDVRVSGVDESDFEALGPAEMVVELAVRKATAVARELGSGLVIGADTTVAIDGEELGKPVDSEDAMALLGRLNGRTHAVFTGLALVDARSGAVRAAVVRSDVTMHRLSEHRIRAYVSTGEPMDKAGAYGIQGEGRGLVVSVEGCFNNVIGLPLCAMRRLIERRGILPGTAPLCRLENGAVCPEELGDGENPPGLTAGSPIEE